MSRKAEQAAAPTPGWAPLAEADAGVSPQTIRRLLWFLLLLGLAARAVRFLVCFPLWDDEAFLCANFIDASFADLLQPLDYHQVAPLGFLAVELAAVKLLGFHEWSLRLFPFLCGLGSMVLFYHLSGKLLSGWPRVMAVAMFAVAYPGIRHGAEAKQYASDLLVGLVLVVLLVQWLYDRRAAWSALLVAFVPLALLFSYPGVFVAGGVSIAWGWSLLRRGDLRQWLFWAAYNLLLVVSFAGVMWLAARGQTEAELEWMVRYWHYALPPREWGAFFRWLGLTHVGDLMAVPAGGGRGGSAFNFFLWLLGLGVLVRRKQGTLLWLALVPMALHFVAALMHRYPYGGHVKFSQYMVPMMCVLMGLGAATLVRAVSLKKWTTWNLRLATAALAAIAVGCMARDFCFPYKNVTDRRHRDFARWFWTSAQFQGEVACSIRDMDNPFIPQRTATLNWTAMYLCNQAIYSPRHHRGEAVQWDQLSEQRPMRIVIYRPGNLRFDHHRYRHWRARLQEKFRIVAWEQFAMPCYGRRRERGPTNVDHIEVITVIPRLEYQRQSPSVPSPVVAEEPSQLLRR